MIDRFPKIYPITDVGISGLSHAEQVAALADGGASLIQLREKTLKPRDFYWQARDAINVARPRGVQIVINDRVDLAMALRADGVHLGQDDLPPEVARRLLGPDAIIGFSTHSLEQARNAVALPIDYLAIGPIFSTNTKADTAPAVGLEGLRNVREATGSIPLIGIGGISFSTASEVLEAGADAVAIISSLVSDPHDISNRLRTLSHSILLG